jgi:2,4-dienoyl-CoA reductase-like NADH-dependent reductase (Old Yellow Enzyme family)
VSSGIAPLDSLAHDESLPYNKTASLGVRLRAALKPLVPVSLVNGIRTPEQVEYLLSNDLIDTVDLACSLLADPAFTEAILYGAPYHKCLSCRGCGFGPIHNRLCPAMVARGADEFHFRELLASKS